MKKITLSIFLYTSAIISIAFGQNIHMKSAPISMPFNATEFKISNSPANRHSITSKINKSALETQSFWLNYSEILAAGIGSKYYTTYLFPDSGIMVKYSDTVVSPSIHMIGNVLDPKADIFGLGWNETTDYTVDSIALAFAYARKLESQFPDIVDTLIIYLYSNEYPDNIRTPYFARNDPNDPEDFPWKPYETDTLRFKGQRYDYTTHRPAKTDVNKVLVGDPTGMITIKYPLTAKDTTSFLRDKFLKVENFHVPAGGLVASAFTFKPGYPYTLNDTLNRMNYIAFLSYEENPSYSEDSDKDGIPDCSYPSHRENDWNVSSIVNRVVRYNIDDEPGWNTSFIPTWAFTGPYRFEHHSISYKVTTSNAPGGGTGVNEKVANNEILYQNQPNPFTDNSIVSYELKKAADMNLSLYDVTGRRIKELANGKQQAGKYQITLNAEDFEEGIYFYTLNINGVSLTKKMVVVH